MTDKIVESLVNAGALGAVCWLLIRNVLAELRNVSGKIEALTVKLEILLDREARS